ncbi:MAG: Gfo/Idh/MocA family oxidoreductase [Acidimicrobiia bacterium]|nr:Gfo/Idh/MocA family oxidoreductase [Acidimicrobiia bacterium]MDH3463077.1 Gfo/Idh/MocA family oxidoreductase [Acidimicrobiia bacterium]
MTSPVLVVIGLGVRGRHWKTAIDDHPRARLGGAVEVREDRIPGSVRSFNSIHEAVEADPDGIIVATPPESHLEIVEAALERGIPVLCEKPLSTSFAAAQRMTHLADRAGTPLLVGMNFRFVKASLGWRELVASREYGSPIFGQFTYIRNRDGRRPDLNDYPLTMAQPMLSDQSIHHLDLMRFVYGREVVAVSARTWNPSTSVYADDSCVAAVVQFEENLTASYLGTWTSGTNRFEFRWRTDFEDGVVTQAEQFGHLLSARREPDLAFASALHDIGVEEPQVLGYGPSEPFVDDTAALLDHFIRVVENKEIPGPTASDHLLTLNLVDSIRLASTESRVVDVAERAAMLGLTASG